MKQNVYLITFYLKSKREIIIHDTDIDSIFQSIYSTIMTKIRKYQAEDLGWTFDSVIEKSKRFKIQTFKR